MAVWCFQWAASNGSASITSWAITFSVLCLVDNVLNEMCQIYFLNVIIADKLRPQIQQIYDVLAHVLETRWSDDYFAGGDIRIIQHLSAACRAARVSSLSGLDASKMLGLLDDKDIALCRSKRLNTIADIGFFSYLTLAIPSRIHDANEIVQRTFLDLIFPVFWLFFFFASYLMFSVSVGLLIGVYIVCLILIFYFTHLVKQDWWREYIGSVTDSVHDNLEIDVNKLGGGISKKVSSWDRMNNIIADEYELTGFNFDMVEYDDSLVKQNYTFPQFPNKKSKGTVGANNSTTPLTSSPTNSQKKSRRPTMMIREIQAANKAKKQDSTRSIPVLKEEDSDHDDEDYVEVSGEPTEEKAFTRQLTSAVSEGAYSLGNDNGEE